MTPIQCRKARQLLGWDRGRLAAESGIEVTIVQQYELIGSIPTEPYKSQRAINVAVIRRSLETAGIEFTSSNTHDVKLKKAST